MSDDQNLIKEVDEEIRQDNYKRAWSKYKKYFFISVTILLILVALINFFKYNKEKKMMNVIIMILKKLFLCRAIPFWTGLGWDKNTSRKTNDLAVLENTNMLVSLLKLQVYIFLFCEIWRFTYNQSNVSRKIPYNSYL
mgnify:CR=1 FL=1